MTETARPATPTTHALPQRRAEFATLTEALDYAARGETGVNFYDGRARLTGALSYGELRERALTVCGALQGLGLAGGDRVALIADTSSAFLEVFFGCQYGGFVPVPLPVPVSLGSREAYLERLRALLQSCAASILVAPPEMLPLAQCAALGLTLGFVGSAEELYDGTRAPRAPAVAADGVAYLQYSSGSTRFPRGVMVTHGAVMANLRGILGDHGLGLGPDDRSVSWLPFYHDMGLVGFVLGPMVSQTSVDYLGAREFAMRPRQWLELISRNRGTIAFAPPFGYEICSRRVHGQEVGRFDLSSWRVAGVGAEPVRAEVLEAFARQFAGVGFDRRAFLPSYGLAESALAVTFARRGAGVHSECIDRARLERDGVAEPVQGKTAGGRGVVDCGVPLPGHEIVIRDERGRALPPRRVGRITLRGPSLMAGYFRDPEATREVLGEDGWLDTGDMGYLSGGALFVTGRRKELIIVNGRNIWPQDLEQMIEAHPQLRPGDAAAFMVPGSPEPEVIVQVQCRLTDAAERTRLAEALFNHIRSAFGVECRIELVPPHSLPRTSSGKLSRVEARRRFLHRLRIDPAEAAVATGSG